MDTGGAVIVKQTATDMMQRPVFQIRRITITIISTVKIKMRESAGALAAAPPPPPLTIISKQQHRS
jgi:hypothetical protein